jgi:antitoxin (DNA-binding transcriptional repressor) of toxin-antitoxin stability system
MTMVRIAVDTLPISKFKATCLAALERVRKTGRPLRITRFGHPVADIVAPSATEATRDWLGRYASSATIDGDLVDPVAVAWEASAK